jgi:probable rRNA maturation factor
MIEVDVLGVRFAPDGPAAGEVRRLCVLAAGAAGVRDGHVAIEYVDATTIARLNGEHRGRSEPTDVLSFPIDGADPISRSPPVGDAARRDAGDGRPPGASPRELGDVVICPEHTADLREAIVHGVLHLVGFDHETDDGEMLALQARLLVDRRSRRSPIGGDGA